ncbi:MarR family transcriptional regulator [Umezawaea sp. Da 62-37]|uniref:MarR family winged helix-turn-helix transcriptional regulator n=1 Tax=Umezawaea sp. Da 62-37 TaxID=3075927 RepID=UPI0028F6EBF5|nr:MarR family transcriptional regulator [Umezawaea sp. Da 62-37]WNV85704.1 MarR family transcriptional regulator [Umezawaea sp. Da 62-37]
MSDPRWLDEREQRAWRSLMAMHAGMSEHLERRLRVRHGMSDADYQVLAHLSESPEGHLRSFALGNSMRWEKSRLSQHLTRMEKRGLVRRERCDDDHRGAEIVLTPAGRDLIEAAAAPHTADVRDVLIDHITPEQMDVLCEIGDRVRARLAAIAQRED